MTISFDFLECQDRQHRRILLRFAFDAFEHVVISKTFTYRFKMTYPGSSMVKDEFRWIHKLIFNYNL